MLSCLAALAVIQSATPAYHIDSRAIAMLNEEEERACGIVFTEEPNIVLVVARDGELRWVDLKGEPKKDVIRRGKVTEHPIRVYSAKQQKLIEEGRKFLIQVYGTANDPKMPAEVYRVLGDKEFCLTDRHDEFFFYSTKTGELLRKVKLKLKNPAAEHGNGECEFTQDLKYLSVGDSEARASHIYSMETGAHLFSVPRNNLFGSVKFMADGKTVLQLEEGKITAYALPTGKVTSTYTLPQPKSVNLVVSPVGTTVAYNTMTPTFGYGGSFIMDWATKKSIPVSKELKEFGVNQFTPDGKTLLLYEQKWLHFVDVATGAHKMTLRPYFTAMWDKAMTIGVSADGSTLLLVNDPQNTNVDLRYSITADLKQKPGEPVKYPIEKT